MDGETDSEYCYFYMKKTYVEPNNEEVMNIMGFASFASYQDKSALKMKWRWKRSVEGELRRVSGLALFRCKEGKGVDSAEWLLLQSSHNTNAWSSPKVRIFTLCLFVELFLGIMKAPQTRSME